MNLLCGHLQVISVSVLQVNECRDCVWEEVCGYVELVCVCVLSFVVVFRVSEAAARTEGAVKQVERDGDG